MTLKKKILTFFFIIIGSLVTLFSAFLLILLIPLLLESASSEELVASLILAALILLIAFLLGILPLRKGIAMLKNSNQTNNSINQENPFIQPIAEGVLPKKQSGELTNTSPVAETSPTTEAFSFTGSESRILFRDKQFDQGDWPVIRFFIKSICSAVLPIIVSIFCYQLLSKSADYRIQPGTWQAYMSLFVVVGGSVFTMLGLSFCAKYNAIGNKFYYYIFDENDGLSFAHMGQDRLGYYVEKKAPLLEKIKSAPSFLYVLLFALSRQARGQAYRLAKMQMYFVINQKFHFVEDLLLGNKYANYCHKIVGVRRIKYFSKGCEVTLVYLRDGVESESKQIIYHETENYDLLMSKIKAFEPNARTGYELSNIQVRQVRKNMYRRMGVLLLGVFVLACLVVGSFNIYFTTNYNASILSPGFFQILEQRLAYRSIRRIYRIIYFFIFTVVAAFGKIIHDIVKTDLFTYNTVEVLEYYESRNSFYKKMLDDYRYYAKVKYEKGTVDVGLSKEMWDKRESVKPLLVLRKNVPYCLIYQKNDPT